VVYFQTKNPNLGKFWRALKWENVGIFYGHLEHFTTIRYTLWSFGTVVIIWYIFPPLWYFVSRKSATLISAWRLFL
jgi:hypothetical protein